VYKADKGLYPPKSAALANSPIGTIGVQIAADTV